MNSFIEILKISLQDIEQYVNDNIATVAYLKEIEPTVNKSPILSLQKQSVDPRLGTIEAERVPFIVRVQSYGLTSADRWKWSAYSKVYNLPATRDKVLAAAKFLDDIANLINGSFIDVEESSSTTLLPPPVISPLTSGKANAKSKAANTPKEPPPKENATTAPATLLSIEIEMNIVEERLKSLLREANDFVKKLAKINDGSNLGSLDNEAKAFVEILTWMIDSVMVATITNALNYEAEVASAIDSNELAGSKKDSFPTSQLVQQLLSYLLSKVVELEFDACKVKQKVKFVMFERVDRHSAKDIKDAFIYAIAQIAQNDRNASQKADDRLKFVLTQINSLITVCNENYGITTSISFVRGVIQQLESFKLDIEKLKVAPSLKLQGVS